MASREGEIRGVFCECKPWLIFCVCHCSDGCIIMTCFIASHYNGTPLCFCIDRLVQERRNCSALAIELRLTRTNPLILFHVVYSIWILSRSWGDWKKPSENIQTDNGAHLILWKLISCLALHKCRESIHYRQWILMNFFIGARWMTAIYALCKISGRFIGHNGNQQDFERFQFLSPSLSKSHPLTHYRVGLRHKGRHFPDDIFKCIFLNENLWILLKISLKFVPKVRTNNILALVHIMAWRRPGDKPLCDPMMVSLLMHICHSASMS